MKRIFLIVFLWENGQILQSHRRRKTSKTLKDICLPIFNINGEIRKEVKSNLLECFKMKGLIAKLRQLEKTSTKEGSALFIGGTKNFYPSWTDTIPPARKFSNFFWQFRKQNLITIISIRQIKRSCWEVPRKIYYTFKKNVIRVFHFWPNRPFIAIKKRLIREYFIVLKY